MSTAVLLDIEGTIADIAFVKQVLFPYARRALPGFIQTHGHHPEVAAELSAAARLAGVSRDDRAAITGALLEWIDEDRKATPLKALQGMVWKVGYTDGEFTGHLYPDAYQWLEQARARAVSLNVYSSGSVAAQKLYFSHSDYGDIVGWFSAFFDTTSGPKKVPAAYLSIAKKLDRPPRCIVFFSDAAAELDAAAETGMQTVQIVRAGTEPSPRHAQYSDFSAIHLDRLAQTLASRP